MWVSPKGIGVEVCTGTLTSITGVHKSGKVRGESLLIDPAIVRGRSGLKLVHAETCADRYPVQGAHGSA